MAKPKRYFIQNPAGAIHEVSKEMAEALLRGERGQGYRPATPDQVKAYLGNPKDPNNKPTQRWDRPIGEPWDPMPEGIDVDELFEEAGGVIEPDQEKEPEEDPEPEDEDPEAE